MLDIVIAMLVVGPALADDLPPDPFAEAMELAAHAAASAEPEPAPEPEPEPEAPGPIEEPWWSLAVCESGMGGEPRWHVDTGNGFHGGLQFHPVTWREFGGERYAPTAAQATPAQQVDVAEDVLAVQGWGAWPACSAKLGLR